VIGVQSERFEKGVRALVEAWGTERRSVVVCDVMDEESLRAAAASVRAAHGDALHALCHSIAYATVDSMRKPFLETTKEDFALAHSVSAYSLVATTRAFAPHLRAAAPSASVMALSYLGASRVVPAYKVMGPAKASLEACARQLAAELGPDGVRVNTISAGPVHTLASRGIAGFHDLKERADRSKLLGGEDSIQASDVADLAAFLASDLSKRITAQTLFVDAGVSAAVL
jgi:enoyl-[acyl-carrier protein] reductase I